jgi:hypothetical protein
MLFEPMARTAFATLTPSMVSERIFFLTASSKAPETTLFDTPRVSLWPVTWPYPTAHAQLANRQTAPVSSPAPDSTNLSANLWMRAEEKLLAFTSTLNRANANGGERYYFQRQNSESPSYDYSQITRNQKLISYLQRLTDKAIPGFNGSLSGKFSNAGRDFILANAFNSVRSLVNQYTFSNDGKLLYSYTPVSFAAFTRPNGSTTTSYVEAGAFSPFPLKIDIGTGEISTISEFPKLREVAVAFHATDRVDPVKKTGTGLNYNDPLNWDNLINVGGAVGYPIGGRTTKMRAVMMLDFFSLRGSTRNNTPQFWVKISSASMQANGANLNFGSAVAKLDYRAVGNVGRKMPSYMLPFYTLDAAGNISAVKTLNNGNIDDNNYGLISSEVTVQSSDLDFNFEGGLVTIDIYGIRNGDPSLDPTSDPSLKIACYNIDFSKWNGQLKIPIAPRWVYVDKMNSKRSDPLDPLTVECPNPAFNNSAAKWACIEIAPVYRTTSAASDPVNTTNPSTIPGFTSLYQTLAPDGTIVYPAETGASSFIYRTPPTYALYSSGGTRIMTDYRKRLEFYPNAPCSVYSNAQNSGLALNTAGNGSPGLAFNPGGFPAITIYDTVISAIPTPTGPGQGDPRLAPQFEFSPIKDVIGTGAKLKQVLTSDYKNPAKQFHTLGSSNNFPAGTGYIGAEIYAVLGSGIAPTGMAMSGHDSALGNLGRGSGDTATTSIDGSIVGVLSARPQGSIGNNSSVGDWSSGPGYNMDGGLLPRPDQDFQSLYATGATGPAAAFTFTTPYFVTNHSASDGMNTPSSKGYFSPNRQIPSPITLLGSLPAGPSTGWETLLFSPNPAAGSSHPGFGSLPDYLFLDLFWMPVAEPYPISEEFSTAGKINLNYRMMPFGYIDRKTVMHALLKSTWLTALDNSLARDYKSHDKAKGLANSQTRYEIDPAETLELFDSTVFDTGQIFRSATQICSMWLVPKGRTSENVETFWASKLLTSDTGREQPYDHLYSRATTRSNTFTVHWRVQVLRKPLGNAPGEWDESKDPPSLSELRGSTLIERYIDPNATDIPDYATDSSAEPLSGFYKWRTVAENYFQP